MRRVLRLSSLRGEDGVTLVFVAGLTIMFVAFIALAVDISHLYVVRNELHNAADAGALAGARMLYNSTGTAINTGANQIGYDAATANNSEHVAVEVNWTPNTNEGDVQRGHWSFASRTFTPNDSTTVIDLWNVTTSELDANTNFINAVRVRTRREATQADSFFARIVGYSGFNVKAEAVAYLGFAGTLEPEAVDQPIAICRQSLLITGEYTCSVGRMINSGGVTSTSNTGGWTNFEQTGNPCQGGTNASELRPLVCATPGGNPIPMTLGLPIGTNGGEIQTVFDDLYNCWITRTGKTKIWQMTLPVVDCPSNNVGTCEVLTGAVTVNVVWINRTLPGGGNMWNDAPTQMYDATGQTLLWASSDPIGLNRWNSFVQNFHLVNALGSAAEYMDKTIYFLPDCQPHEPIGRTGGQNFGILAKIPVLVE